MPSDQKPLTDEVVAAVKRAGGELARRRGLRSGLIGIGLVLLGLLLGSGSALSVPLVIAGAILAAAGLLGPRISGRLAIEWGASGTVIDLHTEVAPPGRVASERVRELPVTTHEANGETIEIEISRLEALTEAAGKPGKGSAGT